MKRIREIVPEVVNKRPRSHSGGLSLICNLTGKEKRFCEEYVYDWNGTRSYMVAYRTDGNSYGGAAVEASRLVKNTNIQNYIDLLQKNVEKQAGISQLIMVEEYMKIAFSSIAHLHNTWIELKDFDELTEDQKACIAQITTRTSRKIIGYQGSDKLDPIYIVTEFIKLRLYDKLKALEGLRKMLGYDAPDKLDIKGDVAHRQATDIPLEELSEQAQNLLFEIGQKQLTNGQRDN